MKYKYFYGRGTSNEQQPADCWQKGRNIQLCTAVKPQKVLEVGQEAEKGNSRENKG